MKLSQLSLADYNQLDGIPVINRDLSASGFTPVANTYYKHTGTTTSSYINGVIYYYNGTGYAALGGKPNVVQSTGNSASDVMSQKAVTDELNKKANSADLATVATSGNYNDLTNKPTIPTIPTNYVTTDTDQDIKGKKTVVPPSNKDNSNQIATTAWAGRRYKSIADFGFTSQTTVKAIVQKIIDNLYEYCTFACTNDNFNNFSDTPDGYGTLIIEVGSNALRPLISFTKQIGDSNSYKHWQANIVRGANNQVTEIQWYELALKKDIPTDIAKIGNLSNPNLLINPNFAINQRGQTSYTGAVYGVDRWKGYQLNVMVCTPNTKGVTLTAPESSTGTGAIYRQIIEPEQVASLAGKTITFSFMATNRGSAGIYMRCLTPASAGDTPSIASGETKIVTKTITLATDITELQLVFRKSAGTLDVDINWAKLEIGSVATEFSPPSIAEELVKCQRYYQRYNFGNNMPLPLGIARNERTVSININIPKLRTNPTFATSGTVKLLNQNITGLTLIQNQYYDGICRLFIETSGLSVGTGILIAGDTDGYYAFDAEI